eukprot:3981502-Pyramimonas_sp.AAC.1
MDPRLLTRDPGTEVHRPRRFRLAAHLAMMETLTSRSSGPWELVHVPEFKYKMNIGFGCGGNSARTRRT